MKNGKGGGGEREDDNKGKQQIFKIYTACAARESKAWIGLDDKDQEGKFVLPSTGQEPQYHHWDHREPNNWLYNEDCVVMDPRTGFWFDESCTFQQHAFVCEQ